MPLAVSILPIVRHRRLRNDRLGPVEVGSARYIGRVGALAVALGVGAAVASPAFAFADTSGSAGASGSDATSTSSGPSAKTTSATSRRSGRGTSGGSSATPAEATSSVRGGGSGTTVTVPSRRNSDSRSSASGTTAAPAPDGSAPVEASTSIRDLAIGSAHASEAPAGASAAEAAVAVPPAAGSVDQPGVNLLTWLQGGSGDGPAAAPLRRCSTVPVAPYALSGAASAPRRRAAPSNSTWWP